MYYVGRCRICGEGTLGIRICAGERDAVVLCDECDAVWLSPETWGPPLFPVQPELPCPECGASLLDEPSHWATIEEIATAGWTDSIAGFGEALGGEE